MHVTTNYADSTSDTNASPISGVWNTLMRQAIFPASSSYTVHDGVYMYVHVGATRPGNDIPGQEVCRSATYTHRDLSKASIVPIQ